MVFPRGQTVVGASLVWLAAGLLLPGCKPAAPSHPVRERSLPEQRDHGRISRELAAAVAQIERNEQRVRETVWAKELLAQECGRIFEEFWDALNATTNKLPLVAAFPLGQIVLGDWTTMELLAHGIELRKSAGTGAALSQEQWADIMMRFQRDGWQLGQTEFRHNRFDTDAAGSPRQSRFYFSAHLTNARHAERAAVEGDLMVTWEAAGAREQPAVIQQIDASHLTVKSRSGDPPFELILVDQTIPSANTYSIGPLLVYDLDGDGLSEIILPARNIVYGRTGQNQYQSKPLARPAPGPISAALIADLDGDGVADLLGEKLGRLLLFRGSPAGTFDSPGQVVWAARDEVKYAMVLTAGDIDADGDLDVFLGQYKLPYDGGQMPTPHYDANDGYPAYLLLNDGRGSFTDGTVQAGLGKKRWRRSFSASFVDLNANGHLDLVVVSDFAGVDLYQNDGRGRFTDVTRQWVRDPHAFGMAHALSDFNADGLIDLLMIGMPSPTADRLEHLNLTRADGPDEPGLRARMTFGNRLYLGRAGGFEQTGANRSIARSGWSWGCSAFDLNNDGFPDVYIANGMESRESVRDYEGDYWLHDIHVANSSEDPAAYLYLQSKVTRARGQGASHGGYEINRLYLNQAGASFLEIGHLFGVALQLDSRNVVSDDLDGDGRMDLLVTSFEPWPEPKQTLRVYRNQLEGGGNWIGFRFREEAGGNSPVGVRVTIQYDGQRAVRHLVTGDSHRAQHASTVHFGLGPADSIQAAEIHWASGQTLTLRDLPLNRYHRITRP